jgi:hypothetical protein
MVLSWISTYTFMPFFVDVNSLTYIQMSTPFVIYCAGWGAFIYNLYCTYHFASLLISIRGMFQKVDALQSTLPSGSNRPAFISPTASRKMIIAQKCVGHFFTSSTATMVYSYYPIVGVPVYCIIIAFGIHFWFNLRIERYICPTWRSKRTIAEEKSSFWAGGGIPGIPGMPKDQP